MVHTEGYGPLRLQLSSWKLTHRSRIPPPPCAGSIIRLVRGRARIVRPSSRLELALTIRVVVDGEVGSHAVDLADLSRMDDILDSVCDRLESSPNGSDIMSSAFPGRTHSMRKSFFSVAILINSSNSSISNVNGFSQITCLPPRRASFEFS